MIMKKSVLLTPLCMFYNFYISPKSNPIFFGSFFLLYLHSLCKTQTYTLSLWIDLYQAFLTKLINHTMCGLWRCISYILSSFQNLFMLYNELIFHSLLWLNNITLYRYITFVYQLNTGYY